VEINVSLIKQRVESYAFPHNRQIVCEQDIDYGLLVVIQE